MTVTSERENSSAETSTDALRRFKLRILAYIDDKCPVKYTVGGDECTIKVQFLGETKRVKRTAGGRGSRARRRKRRELQKLEQLREQNNELPNGTIENNIQDDYSDDDFSVQVTEGGLDVQTWPLPVQPVIFARPTWCQPGGQVSSQALLQQLLPRRQLDWPGPQAGYTPDGPATNFLHHEPKLGVSSIHDRWTRQEKIIAKSENHNNTEHLLTLMKNQMENMQGEISDLKIEQQQLRKTSEKMQTSIQRFREVKERDLFCWHCRTYAPALHYCTEQNQYVHLDRYNRMITYSSTEAGANPKKPEDIGVGKIINLPKFQIDNRIEIIEIQNKVLKKEEEKRQAEMEAMELSQLMNIVFGNNANLLLTEELNRHLNQFMNLKEFHQSNKWISVNDYLSSHLKTVARYHHNVHPKGMLSAEQWSRFNVLRNNENVWYAYNMPIYKRKEEEEESKMIEEAAKELMLKRKEEQKQQMEMIRQSQHESFEENIRQRMRMNTLY